MSILFKGNLLFSYSDHDYTPEKKDEYDAKYHKFKEQITLYLREINPENRWESKGIKNNDPRLYFPMPSPLQLDEENFKFPIHNVDEFIRNFVRTDFEDDLDNFFISEINIYAYGKEGLFVENIQKTSTLVSLVMKACKSGFHRDWDHDAVCVQNKRPPINDVDRAEAEEERRHDRAMKRHQDYAESGGEY